VAVIGGGAAGLVAAREARRRGAATVIVQQGRLGGECTFTGCVPSKTLLAAAAAGVGFDEAMVRVRRAVERIAATEDAAALGAEGIDVVSGTARFISPTVVDVDGRRLHAPRFVVATGAHPAVPPIPPTGRRYAPRSCCWRSGASRRVAASGSRRSASGSTIVAQ